jgi:hypothetical protein
LKKDNVILGEIIEESKILSKGPRIEAHGCFHPLRLQVGKILKHSITAGGYGITLNKKKNLHFNSQLL